MKRILKIVGIVLGVVIIAAAAVLAPVFLGRRGINDGFEMNGVRIVKDGFVSVGVVSIGPNEVALIDAGNDSSGKAILAELSRRHLTPEAVTAILITHGHPDHTGATALFPQAQVMVLAPDVPLVSPRTRVSRTPQDNDTVMLGDVPVKVFAIPGHTLGSAAYLVNGVLFLGDAADIARDGSSLKGSPWIFSVSQAQNRASLLHLDQELVRTGADVKAIACAHSGMLVEGLRPLTDFVESRQ